MVMSQTVVLVCDLCGAEGDSVKTHQITLDSKAVEIELCDRDFTRLSTTLKSTLDAGRKIKKGRR